ncbi:hypothetical protein HD597_000267 [Nonomuraea thailandensis]|uniref:Uncharacterized protein n=1 Tax=Nonomuraea thailandensis TaxID=1188745 RepID=A0A9X2G8Z6_9ACTN|nr:hypothetical protein [Nonomuraea thailandensis]MCP2353247.1 hypothetical protein [Nonomuraea thailandensis]
MSPTTLSEEDLLFDLDLELEPSDGQHDNTIYASGGGGVVCTTNVTWTCCCTWGTSCVSKNGYTCATYYCKD